MIVRLEKRTTPVDLRVRAPPSKSYTHRALIAAALAEGDSMIIEPLVAEDTLLTLSALRQLGVAIEERENGLLIHGTGGVLSPGGRVTIDLKNSGTSMRLLASVALLANQPVVLTGSERMCERPIGDLVSALNAIGGQVRYLGRTGYPPIEVSGRILGGNVEISPEISSQFVTSLLMAAPYAEEDLIISLRGKSVSASYLDITLDLMASFGISVNVDAVKTFQVGCGKPFAGRSYEVEGDYSSASYFFAFAAVCGGEAAVTNLKPTSPQGDRQFLSLLREMGCQVLSHENGYQLIRDGPLTGITCDMSGMPDTVQTLAAVAPFASGTTMIRGISHLRHKESDRIAAIEQVLSGFGAGVATTGDSLSITPGELHGGMIDPANDHRTAMSGAVLGLGIGGVSIRDAGCVAKSYPEFWDILKGAGLWNGMS
ncbi:3-phosphoshikimate 1-carboxyvinyltransferase [Methanocalculus sp. MC3]